MSERTWLLELFVQKITSTIQSKIEFAGGKTNGKTFQGRIRRFPIFPPPICLLVQRKMARWFVSVQNTPGRCPWQQSRKQVALWWGPPMQGSGINEKLINICVSAIRTKFVKQKVDVLPMNGICFIRLNQLFTSDSESTSDLFTRLLTTQHPVAVLRGGLGRPWPPQICS